MPVDVVEDLRLLVRSRFGLVRIETAEEERAHTLLAHLADALGLPLFTWTRSRGLVRDDVGEPVYDTGEPLAAFRHVATRRANARGGVRSLGILTALSALS